MFLGEEEMEPQSVKALEFKAALRQMVEESGVPPKALADLLGVAYSTFMAWIDPSQDVLPAVHRLLLLLTICRPSHALIAYFASLQGAVVVPVPQAGEPDRCRLGEVMLEFSHLLTQHAEATSNGEWEPHEVAQLKEIAARLHANISAQVMFAERQVRETPRVVPVRRGA